MTPTTYRRDIRAIIEQRIAAQWVDEDDRALTRIAWPMTKLTPTPNGRESWLKVDVLFGSSFHSTVDGNQRGTNRNVGVIQLQVFVPNDGSGSALLDTMAGRAREIFSDYSGDGLLCQASGDFFAGIDDAWAFATIRTDFSAYEIVSR